MNLYDFLPPEEHRPSRNHLNLEDMYGGVKPPPAPSPTSWGWSVPPL